ncbi:MULTISPECIES: phosphate acetyltransferase [unclassified Pseudodesulfovibrio]|uniref:phosphate acetyltransferase n=1 Tax=unclassified Pseudodesulfovibrio TaxID=2661612 RepID=UPI000FEB8FFE|nr:MULTISPECIES: phosphate acetyltransferase [unclassified Pseudodesulfovibrio]MCJ2164759.1 phosphate acetyltransferase [Pseudodesulfovibrio sp. S3-i]RWU04054.1 phosphate acetyltransferase [Pseudodesulfovibrio sp. S3]
MSKSLYIAATEPRSGKSAIVLGVMQLLRTHVQRVAIFRPIISDHLENTRDHDIDLVIRHFKLDVKYDRTHAYTLSEAQRMLNEGQQALLLENTLNKFKELEKEYDFVLCEGTDYIGGNAALEYEMNVSIASNLGCPVLLVVNGRNKNETELCDSAQRTIETFEQKGLEVLGLVINRARPDLPRTVLDDIKGRTHSTHALLTYIIPDDKRLGNPTIHDVIKWLDAKVLYGHGSLDQPVDNFLVAAMHIGNFLNYISDGSLIITPGDRSDIILASITSRQSSSFGNIAGMVLTGGIQPTETVHRLIEGWTGVPLPILSVEGHTFKITQILQALHGTIDPEHPAKIASAIGLFESCVDTEELRKRLGTTVSTKITPFMFEYNLVERAKAERQHIVLPEGTSDRILQATEILLRRGVADITLLGNETAIREQALRLGLQIEEAKIVDPVTSPHFLTYAERYFEERKHKGIRMEDAKDRMSDPTYFGTMMVKAGDADGMVSGSVTTTAQTIRPAFEFIKTKPEASIVSSIFLMCMGDRVVCFGDCAVNPKPDARQLAEIALSSAETARIFGIEPKVAMLSYSTGESGTGAEVEKVAEATRIARQLAEERHLDLAIEGPLQYDAAVDPEVARAKMPDSDVAGHATVFVFPDLNTGNNTYKAVQRSVPGSTAIGPVLQGLNKPVNDLSRGCRVRDIVNTVAITAIQAQAEKDS